MIMNFRNKWVHRLIGCPVFPDLFSKPCQNRFKSFSEQSEGTVLLCFGFQDWHKEKRKNMNGRYGNEKESEQHSIKMKGNKSRSKPWKRKYNNEEAWREMNGHDREMKGTWKGDGKNMQKRGTWKNIHKLQKYTRKSKEFSGQWEEMRGNETK